MLNFSDIPTLSAYKKFMINTEVSDTFKKLLEEQSFEDREKLKNIYLCAEYAHKWQKRKSGEDYIIHPVSVAVNLWNQFHDFNLTAAWLLHDAVEDCDEIELSDIQEKFWDDIAFLVDSVTKNSETLLWSDKTFKNKLNKLLYAWMMDIRCFLLKLADREDNIKTLSNLPPDKQVRMAFETQAIFAPLESILDFKQSQTIEIVERNFYKFLKYEKIENSFQLKNNLVRKTYKNLWNESFESVYKHSNNVTWQINDKKILEELVKIPDIDEKIETVSIENWESDYFIFQFKFKKWEIFNKKIPLDISNVYSFRKI